MKNYVAFRDNDFTGAQTPNTIMTYRFGFDHQEEPARHLRIIPTEWVGPKPCLRFEAFFF